MVQKRWILIIVSNPLLLQNLKKLYTLNYFLQLYQNAVLPSSMASYVDSTAGFS